MSDSLFTKTEIDRLLERAQLAESAAGAATPAPAVEAFNFKGVGQLSAAQVTRLLELHAEFAVRLGRAFSALFGSECTASIAGADQMAYGEFIKQSEDCVAFGVLRTATPEGRIVLHADLASVLPVVDLLLGGAGAAAETIRPLTDIEQEVFVPVLRLLGTELQSSWAAFLQSSLAPEHFGAPANAVPGSEKGLFLKLEITIGEVAATWTLMLPSLVATALTRLSEQQASRADVSRSAENQRRMRERLLDGRFRMELFLPPSTVSMRKLAHLKPGQVIVLKPRASEPIHFNIAGIKLFHASPVSCGVRRGAQIKRSLVVVKTEEKEAK